MRNWQNAFSAVLPGYKQIGAERLGSIGLFIFAKRSIFPLVSNVQFTWVSTGTANYPNKGAVSMRMTIEETTVAFVSSHLAAGILSLL